MRHITLQADLGWGKPVRLRGVRLASPSALGGDNLASADAVYSNISLWDIVRGQPHDVFVEKARVDATLADNGQLKWMQLLDYVSPSAALNKLCKANVERDNVGLAGLTHIQQPIEGLEIYGKYCRVDSMSGSGISPLKGNALQAGLKTCSLWRCRNSIHDTHRKKVV